MLNLPADKLIQMYSIFNTGERPNKTIIRPLFNQRMGTNVHKPKAAAPRRELVPFGLTPTANFQKRKGLKWRLKLSVPHPTEL